MPRLPSVDTMESPVAQTSPGIVSVPGGDLQRAEAQAAAVQGQVGGQVQQVGNNLQTVQNTIQTRQDAVSRAGAIEDFTSLAQQEYLKAETEGDLSNMTTTEGYGKLLADKQNEILGSHGGTPESRAALQARLDGIRGLYTRQAATKGAALGQTKVLGVLTNQLSGLNEEVMKNPGSLDKLILAGDAMIADMAPGLSPEQETLAHAAVRKELALSAVNALANRGAVKEARKLLADTPGLVAMMGPDQQRLLDNQLSTIERKDDETRNAAYRKMDDAAIILGLPNRNSLSLAQRVKLAGLSEPAGPQTAQQKIDDLEKVLGPLSPEQRRKALGVEASGGASSPAGKIVEDRQKFISQFGENSPQVKLFDEAASAGNNPTKLSDVGSMRKEYANLSAPFMTVRDAFSKIANTVESPAGDISLVFSFMKMLDPGSTVREGEYATAQNAASVPDRVRQQYNKAMTGEGLLPEQRADFRNQSASLFQSALNQQAQLEDQYRGLAQRNNMRPEDVAVDLIGGYRPHVGGGPAPAAAPAAAGATTQAAAPPSGNATAPLPVAAPNRIKLDLEGNVIGAPPSLTPPKPAKKASERTGGRQ